MRTLKSLIEAIEAGIEDAPPNAEMLYDTRILKHLKDYLAQHFTVAMLQHPDMEQALMDLFNRITR